MAEADGSVSGDVISTEDLADKIAETEENVGGATKELVPSSPGVSKQPSSGEENLRAPPAQSPLPPDDDLSSAEKGKVDLLLRAVGDAPIMKKKRWAVDPSKKVAWVSEFVRKYIKCEPNESLFLYVNQYFSPSPDQEIGSLYESNRDSNAQQSICPSTKLRRASQIRLPPFNAEKEAIEYFYKREKACPSLPKRILEQIFGSDFVDRLMSRPPIMKRRNYTPNQYEDLARLIRVYLRHIATAEMFYARAVAMLPPKAFTSDKVATGKPRISIFGGRRQSTGLGGAKGDPKKIRLAYFSGGFGHFSGGFGQLTKGGKKVAPVDQLTFEDPMMLKQTLNITREDYNPSAPVNVVKFNAELGFVSEETNISQSEIIFHQTGTKVHFGSIQGKKIIVDRAERYPFVNGKQMGGPRKRYNYIESVFRPQQIWQRQSYEIAVETDSMSIVNFRVKVRKFSVDDLYVADQLLKKTEKEHAPKQESVEKLIFINEKNVFSDEEIIQKMKKNYEFKWKLNLINIHKKVEEIKRKVADAAEWPTQTPPTKLITLKKQKSIQHIFRNLKLMEKLILQPFFRSASRDYRYFEDLLDVGRTTGSLLPLWNFRHPRLRDVKVEHCLWHPRYPDMFVCSGGRDEVWDPNIGPGQTAGFVAWFSLRNPTYPEYQQYLAKPVMSFDIHPRGFMLVGGTNDGNILYINLGVRSDAPLSETSSFDEVHTKTVVYIKFLPENADGESRFFSVGLEGNFREWTIEKHTIIPTRLLLSTTMPGFFHNPNWHLDEPHCVAFSHHEKNLFLIGTLFGFVHLCDWKSFKHVKYSIRPHKLPVSAVRWNSFHKDIFLTSSYDFKIYIFDLENLKNGHILKLNFDVGVCDVTWSPFNSTMFGVLLTNAQFLIFDLALSKYAPLCAQTVALTTKSRPEKISFNSWGPYVLISDLFGSVQVFKLSPNLRKIVVLEQAIGLTALKGKGVVGPKKKQAKGAHGRYPGVDLKIEIAKIERILAIFRDTEPPTLKLSAKPKQYMTISGEPLSTKLPDGTELRLTGGVTKEKGKESKVAEK